MNKEQKIQIVKDIADKFQKAKGVVITDYKGLSVKDISELRLKLQNKSCEYKVFKNSLIQLAINEIGLESLKDFLIGPTAIAFEYEDAASSAKIISDFQKEHETLKVKAGLLGGKILKPADIKSLAFLPDRNMLLSLLMARMKLPILGMANVLAAPLRELVNVLDSINQQKEA